MGVDKVLIYRYFENLPSLLQTFGKEGNYWITVEELIGDETTFDAESLTDWMVLLLTRFMYDLQERPITQEIMRWELLQGNELTHELATVRDQVAIESLEFLKQKYSFPPDKDIPAISAVLIAGIVYLVMRTKVSDTFLGIDFSSPIGWQRIERAIASLLGAIVENDEQV
ncbi:TetR/AcrR family transcriptional regulator [Atlanticothrix silvestris]|uniref:TetR/AcrR family transcriptional regulator n=1 Tax=Atlanticothrix silvestris TaxID=2840444 RepID=UPI001CED81C0|nr:TetR/AcrR family transcriptional regulator [Atlanticothrix silvestris]